MSGEAILQHARENLRCIDAAALSFELFSGASVREAGVESPYELSRPLLPGEKISYFISHSWHDEVSLEAPVESTCAFAAMSSIIVFWKSSES